MFTVLVHGTSAQCSSQRSEVRAGGSADPETSLWAMHFKAIRPMMRSTVLHFQMRSDVCENFGQSLWVSDVVAVCYG